MPKKTPTFTLLLLLLILLNACENSLEEVEIVSDQFKVAVETIKDVQMLYSDEGKVKIKLTAPLSLRHKTQDPYLEFPEGLTLEFFSDSLTIQSKLTAKYGIRYEKKQRTEVRDQVVWDNQEKKETLETEELIWDERQKKIFSNKFVKITTTNESIYGKGFETNQSFTNYKIRQITGTVRINAKQLK